jgi:RNA polymerase sigma factor (sigma-70 family)
MLMMELSQAMPITSEMVWTSFSNQLKQFIRKRASNEYDADDILQDVFYKIHLHLSRLNDAHKIESWIYQITRHAIIDYYRNRKHESELPETGLQEENSVLMLDSSDAHPEGNGTTAWPLKFRCEIQGAAGQKQITGDVIGLLPN